jgi:hypothetical protein
VVCAPALLQVNWLMLLITCSQLYVWHLYQRVCLSSVGGVSAQDARQRPDVVRAPALLQVTRVCVRACTFLLFHPAGTCCGGDMLCAAFCVIAS